MELKIWVEGIQRIVCGVTVNTTCQDIVYALAHATGKVGRFTLIERWRNNERLLAPTEYPLKLILKWGEYSSDVQFILQRSELTKRPAAPDEKGQSRSFSATILTKKQPLVSSGSDLKPHQQQPMHLLQQHPKYANDYIPLNRCKRLWKSFGSLETPKSIENVGIVTGVQQRIANTSQPTPTLPQQSGTQEKSISNISLAAWTSASDTISNYYPENPTNEINLKKNASNNILNSSENVLDIFNGNSSNNKFPVNKTCVTPDLTNTPPISSNGALVPPPYRHPPPPRNSPMQLTQQTQVRLLEYSTRVGNNLKKADVVYINSFLSGAFHDNFFQAAQYKDLIHLIKFQRDKITSQQSELTKAMLQGFWKRWHLEYLTSLQQRRKWNTPERNIAVDDVVLLKEPNLPPSKWILGRITKIHPGNDGKVRVVTVVSKFGEYTRPIVKVAPFPSAERPLQRLSWGAECSEKCS